MLIRIISPSNGSSLVTRFVGHTRLEGPNMLQKRSLHVHPALSMMRFVIGQNAQKATCKLQERCRVALATANQQFTVLSEVFAKQFYALAAQRIRRSTQIIMLYKELGYDKYTLSQLARHLHNTLLQHKNRPLGLLFGAALFSWEKESITDSDMRRVANEINLMKRDEDGKVETHLTSSWEVVIDKKNLSAWRKPIPNTYLYEYKMFGTFTDVPARAFFNAQTDMKYRRQWDKLIIKLDVVDRDPNTKCEIVQWIMHFPYPMYSREYVYVRKRIVDPKERVMVLMSRATDHPFCPRQDDQYVRVDTYMSHMVIRPHKSFDENGFDFILTYHDDPKSAFPKVAYNWMASTAVPDFVEKMHQAAITLHEWKKQGKWIDEDTEEEAQDKKQRDVPM